MVLEQVMKQDLLYHIKGSLIEINEKSNDKDELYIFCSSPTNYKVHMIYAYVLDQIGYRVCQVDEKTSKDQVTALLEKVYGIK